jgi:hypothetical protein
MLDDIIVVDGGVELENQINGLLYFGDVLYLRIAFALNTTPRACHPLLMSDGSFYINQPFTVLYLIYLVHRYR